MKQSIFSSLIVSIFLLGCHSAQSQMTSRVVADDLFIPWEMVWGPDDHIWFTQKNGYICRLEPVSGQLDTVYHEPQTLVQNEGGMMGLVLHPDFPATPHIFVAYNFSQGSSRVKVVRYTYSGSTLTAPLTLVDDIQGAGIHNGCRLVIVGDKLIITTGDAADQSLPQDLSSLNGKVLRINLDGTIPNDNPIFGSPLWSWGHRNAQGLVYANNRLYSSEHGPSSDDELNIILKGRNYGWPEVRGFCNTQTEIDFCNDSNVVEPLVAWTPTIAVGGIDYYDHSMFPGLANSILMVTLKDQSLYQLQLNSNFDSVISTTEIAGINFGRLRDLCIAPDGRIFISTSNSSASGTGALEDRIIELYDPNVNTVASITNQEEWAVYPNPTSGQLTIRIPSLVAGSAYAYKLIDVMGKIVNAGRFTGKDNTLDIKSLPAGSYTLRMVSPEGRESSRKIMKQ